MRGLDLVFRFVLALDVDLYVVMLGLGLGSGRCVVIAAGSFLTLFRRRGSKLCSWNVSVRAPA